MIIFETPWMKKLHIFNLKPGPENPLMLKILPNPIDVKASHFYSQTRFWNPVDVKASSVEKYVIVPNSLKQCLSVVCVVCAWESLHSFKQCQKIYHHHILSMKPCSAILTFNLKHGSETPANKLHLPNNVQHHFWFALFPIYWARFNHASESFSSINVVFQA